MECFCFLRSIVDILHHGSTAYKAKWKQDFRGPVIPFGAAIEYIPITQKDKDRIHSLGKQTITGIFVGYEQQSGGGWSGNLKILDRDQLNEANTVGSVHVIFLRKKKYSLRNGMLKFISRLKKERLTSLEKRLLRLARKGIGERN